MPQLVEQLEELLLLDYLLSKTTIGWDRYDKIRLETNFRTRQRDLIGILSKKYEQDFKHLLEFLNKEDNTTTQKDLHETLIHIHDGISDSKLTWAAGVFATHQNWSDHVSTKKANSYKTQQCYSYI